MPQTKLEALLPLLPLQGGMLFHNRYRAEEIDAYVVHAAFELRGPLDAERLHAACQRLVDRHQSLRVAFLTSRDGQVLQAVAGTVAVPWRLVDLPGPTAGPPSGTIHDLLASEQGRRFDTAVAPLIRFVLVRLAPGRHVLAITAHHTVLDGWSLSLLLTELFLLYAGRDADLPRPAPLRDHLAWLTAQDQEKARESWRKALTGIEHPTLVAPATDGGRLGGLAGRVACELSEEVTAALTAFARSSRLTLNTCVQGAWALLLSSLTGGTDLVYGTTVALRPAVLDGVERMVGPLINTVPARIRLRPQESIAALLARIQDEHASMTDYHFLSLPEIHRLAGHPVLFDTSIVFQNAPLATGMASLVPGLEILTLDNAEDFARTAYYPLNLAVVPGRRLSLTLDYARALFTRDQVQRMTGRLTDFLTAFAAHPDVPVGRIEWLDTRERATVLANGTGRSARFPDATVPRLFEQQVRLTPYATAVAHGAESLTYHELNERANRLAHYLIANGAGPERVVGLLLWRSLDLVTAWLAVLKAGAAYLPLDPSNPGDRISFQLAEAKAGLLIASGATRSSVPGEGAAFREGVAPALVLLDDPDAAWSIACQPATDPRDEDRISPLTSANLAYVLYTSGSTGRPKGVAVEHRSVTNLHHDLLSASFPGAEHGAAAGRQLRIGWSGPLFFDGSWNGLLAMIAGHQLHIVDESARRDPAALVALAADRLDTLDLTPSLGQQLMAEGLLDQGPGRQPEILLFGGEAVGDQMWRALSANPEITAYNLYGPTECTVQVLLGLFSDSARPSLGTPVANVRTYVLDRALRLVPDGVRGELYIGGDALARSYISRPELTAERFVADPYGPPGARMYRTGDIVRRTLDGDVVYLGRADDQVKLRGFRIELGEIEAAIVAVAGVREAAVVVREDRPETRHVVAYFVPEDGAEPLDAEALRVNLAHRLPGYMIPAAFVPIPAIPLNGNGKLDRRALPAPEFTPGHYRPPRDDRERALCRLFGEVLGIDRVGADDSFFSLGGDSILSLRLIHQARKAGLAITPRDVFAGETPAALARSARDASAVAVPGEPPDAGVGRLQPMPIQCQLFQLGGSFTTFHQAVLLRLPATVRLEHLVRALQAVLDHHDALRMVLSEPGEQAGWRVETLPRGTVRAQDRIRRVDAAGMDGGQLRSAVAEAARAAQTQLNPATGSIVRAVWFDAGPDAPGRLLMLVHHIAVDSVSWRILVPDLIAAWEAACRGAEPEPDAVPTSLRTWAARLSEEALGPDRGAELELWTDILAGRGVQVSGRPDPAVDVHATARTLTVTLPPEYTEPLFSEVVARYRTGADAVLLTALALAVLRWRGVPAPGADTSLLVDLEGHGREDIDPRIDLSRTVGWFTSMYPVRLDHGAGLDPDQALKRIKEQLRAIPGKGLGYGLLRYLNPRTAEVLAAFAPPLIGFNFLGTFTSDGGGDWDTAPEASVLGSGADDQLPLGHALEINALVSGRAGERTLMAAWQWAGRLLSEDDVRVVAELWLETLQAIVARARRPGAGGLTPSDVAVPGVGQDELDTLGARFGGVSDVLPLSGLQQGILFHARYDSQGGDPYTVQTALLIDGPLDAARLRMACQRAVDRHQALRAAFTHRGDGTPVQIIAAAVDVPWREVALGADAETEAVHELLAADRRQRFDMAVAPLIRFTVIRLAPDRHVFAVTSHHILLDGWSAGLLLSDLFLVYAEREDELTALAPYRDYLTWVAAQDAEAARGAWRDALDGARPALVAPGSHPSAPGAASATLSRDIDETVTAALTAFARASHVTLNTCVQTAWALLVAWLTGQSDIVSGSTVTVRPAGLPGAEHMVGLLINTLPARIRLLPRERVSTLLSRVQGGQAALSEYQYLALPEIHRAAGKSALFDTATVFQNYPGAGSAAGETIAGLRINEFSGHDTYHYPLKLMIVPGNRLHAWLSYRTDAFTAEEADRILLTFAALLEALPDDPYVVPGAAEDRISLLCRLFADVLGLAGTCADDDFFALGGDSLSVLTLAGRIAAETGTSPEMRTIFRHPTPARLARFLWPGDAVRSLRSRAETEARP